MTEAVCHGGCATLTLCRAGCQLLLTASPVFIKRDPIVCCSTATAAETAQNSAPSLSRACPPSLAVTMLTRKENTVLNRLHIGHSYLTHYFILRKEEAPVCVACNSVITVKNILIECADLLDIRKKYFKERSLYSLFRNVIPEVFFYFYFLREIGVFYKV